MCGICASGFALPTFDPFTSAVGQSPAGTAYANGSPLFHQTNALSEGWVYWNGGSGSAVTCVNSNMVYGGFPAAFPPAPANAAVLIPGLAQGLNANGYSAALALSKVIASDPANLVTNKIFASFLLSVPSIGNLAQSGTQPIFFGGFNNSTAGDLNTTVPGKSFKLFLEGNSSAPGAATAWTVGIADNSGGSTERFDPAFRAAGTVLFVVIDYEFGINGQNDNAHLWVNPDVASFGAASSPTATVTITIASTSGNGVGQAANFFLYNRSGASLWGSVLVGNLRIGTTWGYATGAPEFSLQPLSQNAAGGSTVNFSSATVSPSTTVSYQWQKNGAIIPGVANPVFSITNAVATNAGSYAVVASNVLGSATSSNAVLSVSQPLNVLSPPQSRVERAGENTAFTIAVDSGAAFQWKFNGNPISGATSSTLILTNIQITNTGNYTVLSTTGNGTITNSATLSVSTNLLHLSPDNLIVARIGDGAQALSGATGNTIYLDQFTTNGSYISTLMVPNTGPGALLVPGTGDGIYEGVLTLSANEQFINFTGYNVSYPYAGGDVTGGNVTIRGIGAVNGLGYYALALTNIGLYSGGSHFIRSAVSTDGLTNFWTTGAASSGGIKYIAPGLAVNGQGIPVVGGGNAGTRVVNVAQGSIVFSDAEGNLNQTGVNGFDGLPTGTAPSALAFPTGAASDPNDFAISPDGNTIYIADDSSIGAGGGIQRWDFDQVQWSLTYVLGDFGARGLTVDFDQFSGDGSDAAGAVLYATTAETTGNRLIRILDTGANSPATTLSTAGPNQLLRGVRFGPAAAPVYVSTPPQNQTNGLGGTVTFTAGATGSLPIGYQWQFAGTNIAGATLSALTLSNLAPASAGVYTVVAANDISTTNASAALSLFVNTNTPVLLGAQSLGTTQVELLFSATITPDSATNIANYNLTGADGSLPVFSAMQDASGSNIFLGVGSMTNGGVYTAAVSNVANAFAPANVLAYAQTNFVATSFAAAGIGTGQPAQIVSSNGLTIVSAGTELNGANDHAGFSSQLQTGNFDLAVCVSNLGAVDVWSEAGLMARQSLNPGSVFAASIATPGMSGCFFNTRGASNGTASVTGTFPANFPNTWLRLSRAGSTFIGYASYDGQTWTQLGSASVAMTDPIYVGLAVTSNNTNSPTSAQFINFGATSPASTIGANPNPHEQLGPCSRKTGIVFSEIMYKPAPRADSNNCEYIEIYNSQPFFHDISGYQITCGDMHYAFPPNTIIPAGGFLVIAASPSSIQTVYGITNVMGPYTGSLKKSETLELLDEQTNILLTVPYTAAPPWPVAANATGHSIVLANPSYGEGDPRAWDISDVVGGSPGTMESYRPSPLRNVVINEFLAHSENAAVPQFVELFNHSASAVDVSGCVLTDNPATNLFVIPPGTVIPPNGFASFDQTQLGFLLNGSGDMIYFIKPDGSRILDAVQFEPQADGVSFGRSPDGANDFYPFTSATPGTNNSAIVIGSIVINELMYDPISENDDDQYIELYNRSTNAVSLANWQFTAGITFTFPANAVIAPNGYAVVGRNTANLFAHYTNLNSSNTWGNYTGKLSHNGERVALARPQSYFGGASIYVVEDEVTYGTGGRWGQWSSGGGSSLELIDPHSNHRLAANWTDSDDTQKSQWVTISNTGVLDNGTNYTAGITYAQVGLLDVGECLVDNAQVLWQGTNYITNSTFESGLGGWNFQGDHVRSSLEPSGYQSGNSLHVRCSDKFWHAENSCEALLPANNLAAGNTVTLQFQARWLHGWPEPILRLDGNWLEATGAMPVPANLGTPGMPNSAAQTNIGPAIFQVTHTPPLPALNQPATVTARIDDPDGATNCTLFYRIDPATNYTAVPMIDTGGHLFSAAVPGPSASSMAAFYISATDNAGASTRFPALRPANNEPVRECNILFGDGNPVSSFGTYHLWFTKTNLARWIALADLANEYMDCTFVNNNRVIYNMGGRYTGSPAHQNDTSPVTSTSCSYEWQFSDDDKFLGATSFHKIHAPGNGGPNDPSLQREQTSYSFLRALRVPWLFRRYAGLYVNGVRHGPLMEDSQLPNSDMVKEYFPNDDGGFLYKFDQWYEFAAMPSGSSIGYAKVSTHTLLPYTTTGGVFKATRYRPMYQIRRTPDSMNNFTNIYAMVQAASSYGTPGYVASMENLANMENWMRVFAANHAVGNSDVYGGQTGQNLYGYIGALGTKLSLMMWDMNIDLGTGSGPGANLFSVNPADTNTQNIFNCPTFRRMYWRAFEEMVNGQFSVAAVAPLANAKYNAFLNSNLGAYQSAAIENPSSAMLPWIAQAQASIASQLAAVNATQFSVNGTVTVSNNVAYLTGAAPVAVDSVWINGVAWPLAWTSLTNWSVAVPMQPGTNQFAITGVDIHGQPMTNATGAASAVTTQLVSSATGQIVINEIMYNPPAPNAGYIELFNNSASNTFDLSGYQLQSVNYTFPSGSSIAPRQYLALAANGAAFAGAYGGTVPVFDTFSGVLQPGQVLALVDAGTNIVTCVRFDAVAPWPTNGAALGLIDSTQDNWREGNWAAMAASPAGKNPAATNLPAFAPLWINEIQADNRTGITNRAGQRAPWLELYNPTSNSVSLNGLYLANNYAALTNWAFPASAAIGAGQFLIIFADGQTNLSTVSELHTGFTLPAGAGSLALSRIYNGQPQVLDYLDYTNLPPNYSYGSFPDGQSFDRQQFFTATPGATNNGATPGVIPYLALNSVYTQNFDSLPNPGATTVQSDNPVTINSVKYTPADPLDFSASVAEGGLSLSATMTGWYGSAVSGMKLGASAGDQSTGGIISFGPANTAATNRALGLLATSSSGGTAFGVAFANETTNILNQINLSYVGELWRQQPAAKYLTFSYYVDSTGNNAFSTNVTQFLPTLDVSFPSGAQAALDGTLSVNQISLAVSNQLIADWPPGAALWLVWQMTNNSGNAQGLAIDNLSFSASTTYVPPAITAQPQSQTVNSGNNPQFIVSVSSTPPVGYQWFKNASPLPGETNAILTLNDVNTNDAGTYTVAVTNPFGATNSSAATLTVNSATGLPVIDPQPQSQSDSAGGAAAFFISASGTPPLTYQWFFDNASIAGATNTSLVIANLAVTNAGTYSVQVTDTAGPTQSGDAILTILSIPPSIVTQPLSQTVAAGTTVNLSASASGTAPLIYQWWHGATPLSDNTTYHGTATSALTINNVQSAQTGGYSVVVNNIAGTNTSAQAMINLIAPSYVAYTNAGAVYSQNFDSLPNPGATTVNANNPVTIGGTNYTLANPTDLAYPILSANGGLSLSNTMAGWYGFGGKAIMLGASDGAETTGGIISFGPVTGATTNRSLGLLATSSSGATAFAVRILNQTPDTLANMSLSFTGELWRQQTTAKSIAFTYYVDPTGSNVFSVNNITAAVTNLNLSFATGASGAGTGGPLLTTALAVTNQAISNCPPGAALWLTWQMANAGSGGQGMGIDNFSFSATGPQTQLPSLSIATTNANVILSWPLAITNYTLQVNSIDLSQSNAWQNAAAPNVSNTVILPVTNHQQFFRLKQ